MKVLRDFYCTECDRVSRDVWCDREQVDEATFCHQCNAVTQHLTVINGGSKSRWRYCDFSDDPVNYFGQTSHTVSVVDEEKGEDVRLLDDFGGGAVHDLPSFTDPDIRGEKRDRAEHAVKQERGKNPIYVGT